MYNYFIPERNTTSSIILAIMAAFTLLMEEYYVFGTQVNLSYLAMLMVLVFVSKKQLRPLGLRMSFFRLGALFIILSLIVLVLHGSELWFRDSVVKNMVFAIPVTFIILYFYTDSFNIIAFLKCVTVFSVVATVVIVYQRLSFILLGDYYSNFSLDFIPGIEQGREDALEIQIRPAGFFSEPAHYAEFCLPVFAFHLLKKNIWMALLLAFGIIISGSTNGLVCLLVIVLSVLFLERNGKAGNGKRIVTAVIIASLFGVGYFMMDYYFPEIMAFQFGKLENTDVEDSARLLGPLPILRNFDVGEWLFGIGMGNKDAYINAFQIKVAGGEGDSMTNTIFSLLVFFGLTGLLIFSLFILRVYNKCCRGSNKTYFVLMFVLFFSTNFIFSGNLLYYMFFVANTKYLAPTDKLFFKTLKK